MALADPYARLCAQSSASESRELQSELTSYQEECGAVKGGARGNHQFCFLYITLANIENVAENNSLTPVNWRLLGGRYGTHNDWHLQLRVNSKKRNSLQCN